MRRKKNREAHLHDAVMSAAARDQTSDETGGRRDQTSDETGGRRDNDETGGRRDNLRAILAIWRVGWRLRRAEKTRGTDER